MIHRTRGDHDCFLMDCRGRAETLARLESDHEIRPVRMTETLMLAISEATVDGPVTVGWIGPDDDGFYEPMITVKDRLLSR